MTARRNRTAEIPTLLGLTLDYYRRRQRLTFEALAERVGTDYLTAWRAIRGNERLRRETVDRFAKGLALEGLDYDRLLVAGGYAPDWVAELYARGSDSQIASVLIWVHSLTPADSEADSTESEPLFEGTGD